MNNQTYKDILKRYLELKPKILGAVRISETRGKYDVVNGNIHNEFVKTRDELGRYLEFLSDNELSKIFTDPVIGSKAGAILDERIKTKLLKKMEF